MSIQHVQIDTRFVPVDRFDTKRQTYPTRLLFHVRQNLEARNLHRMMQFAEIFPDRQIVVPMARQLSWSHFVALLEERIHLLLLEARERHARTHLISQTASSANGELQ